MKTITLDVAGPRSHAQLDGISAPAYVGVFARSAKNSLAIAPGRWRQSNSITRRNRGEHPS
jgi:hypothetical protein